MTSELEWNDDLSAAKAFLWKLFLEGHQHPCDIGGNGKKLEADVPAWFELEKYNRGRKFYEDNRLAIAASNVSGVLTLLSEPKGLETMMATNKSNDPESSRLRYVETILHMDTWFTMDLSPDSPSWKSLLRVRKLHLMASNNAINKEIGFITQAEICLTAFGFMGFAILKPHLLGVKFDKEEDHEALIHFWAVVLHMLGCLEEFNMCLQPMPVVKYICQAALRYIFMPAMQFETQQFKTLLAAFFDGLRVFVPFMDYEFQMFTLRRLAGIPGYQYCVDLEKETLCPNMFNEEEIKILGEKKMKLVGYKFDVYDYFLTDKVPVVNIKRAEVNITETDFKYDTDENANMHGKYVKRDVDENLLSLHKYLDLHPDDEINITYVDETNYKEALNDSKFYELSPSAQRLVKMSMLFAKSYQYRIPHYLAECGYSYTLRRMKRYAETHTYRQLA